MRYRLCSSLRATVSTGFVLVGTNDIRFERSFDKERVSTTQQFSFCIDD